MTTRTQRSSRARRLLFSGVVACLALGFLGHPAPASGQDPPDAENIETDPIRCWWRTSTGAVRTGETFSVVLTCAVVDIDEVQVVPDESRLAVSVMQFTPFEVVGGNHPADLRAGQRRFIQYEYLLRVINPDAIGLDLPLPPTAVHYRINSRMPGSSALEGRDLTYVLPPYTMRVLSVVPEDAEDIRDTTTADFGRVETLTSRAGVLDIVALTLMALGTLIAGMALVAVVRRARPQVSTGPRPASPFAVARLAGRELLDVQREVAAGGWTDERTSRALAAARVIAACAIHRPVAQRPLSSAPGDNSGQLVLRRLSRRRRLTGVSSAVTPGDIARLIARLPESATARRGALESLRSALVTLRQVQYGRSTEPDSVALDAALAEVIDQAKRVQLERVWPRDAIRQWTVGAEVEAHA